jgi:organic hydroperoxide reductase OsmC/OhrA
VHVQIRASVQSSAGGHEVAVSTDGRHSAVAVPGRPGGGSALNGGELLCAALATCYCNDVYREAARRGVVVRAIAVEVEAEFGGRGAPARRIAYRAQVESDAPAAEIEALLRDTDAVAEVQNTLRAGVAVELRLAPDTVADVS